MKSSCFVAAGAASGDARRGRPGDRRRCLRRCRVAAGHRPALPGDRAGALAYRDIIDPAGFVKSSRPERHASFLSLWQLADRGAAEQWLREHPDRPDPGDDDQGDGKQSFLFPFNPTNDTGATAATAAPVME